jgi:hypothetical protein
MDCPVMATVLIDADSIGYRAGFAGQVSSLQIAYEDGEGKLHTRGFLPDPKLGSARKQLEEFKAQPGIDILDEMPRVDAEPVENVLHSTKHMVQEILAETGVDKYRVFLTGKTNYRDAIAKQRPYKGNRDKLTRPVHYDAIREYLVKYWKAEIVEGEEADDRISILARTSEYTDSVIASIDKDLDQIPGKHYDFVKRVHYNVSDEEAERCFYRQCLSGDAVDNIPGCYKLGYAKADALLSATAKDDWWPAIVEAYEKSKEWPGCPYKDIPADEVALETAQLVRLRTYPGEIWQP